MKRHFNDRRFAERFNEDEYLPYHEALPNVALKSFRRRGQGTEYIAVNTRLCVACWQCVESCKKNVLGSMNFWIHKHVRIVNAQNCVGCGACAKICPTGAIYQWQKPVSKIVEN